jgi:hypothetical protein
MLFFWSFFIGILLLVLLGVPRHIIPWFVGTALVLLAVTGAIG